MMLILPTTYHCKFTRLFMSAWIMLLFAAAMAPSASADDISALTERFYDAARRHDIEAMMAISDIPYSWDGVEEITDAASLRKKWEGVFSKKDLKGLELKRVREQTTDRDRINAVTGGTAAKMLMRAGDSEALLIKTETNAMSRSGQQRPRTIELLLVNVGGEYKITGFKD